MTVSAFGRVATRGFAIVALSAGLLMNLPQANAATAGHLRSPWSYESQVRERLNYAAQAREEYRWGQVAVTTDAHDFPELGLRRAPICAGIPQHCAF
jgi:hypothetical protein